MFLAITSPREGTTEVLRELGGDETTDLQHHANEFWNKELSSYYPYERLEVANHHFGSADYEIAIRLEKDNDFHVWDAKDVFIVER